VNLFILIYIYFEVTALKRLRNTYLLIDLPEITLLVTKLSIRITLDAL
jgi:hypothetical protein